MVSQAIENTTSGGFSIRGDNAIVSIMSDDLDQLIAKNLRRLRKSRGWSQSDMGEALNLDKDKISAYENAHIVMGKGMMMRFCKALHVRPWEFYIEDDSPLVTDSSEQQQLELFREARELGVAEEVTRYGRYQIEGARRAAAGSVDERLRRGHELLKKHLRKKKSA